MEGNDLMEEIMAEIRDCLRPNNPQVNYYNKVWDAIEDWHNRHLGENTHA